MAHASRAYRSRQDATAAWRYRPLSAAGPANNPIYLCAQIRRDGLERFSFPQRVTLYPGITMRTRSAWGPELETLAVNLLLEAKPAWHQVRTLEAARRVTRLWAEPFAMECLAPYAGHSWVMTASTVVETVRGISDDMRRRNGRRRG